MGKRSSTTPLWAGGVLLLIILAIVVLLGIGVGYGILSPRQWALGMLAWPAAVLVLAAILRKRAVTNGTLTCYVYNAPGDENARKHALKQIRRWKTWTAVLAAIFPIGVANGIINRAWLPTLGGAAISGLVMYLGVREIKRHRRHLALTRR